MKRALLILSAIILCLTSCERMDPDNYSDPLFKIGDNLWYSHNDFELYDSSTHMLYFKKNHTEFNELKLSTFAFYADTTKIYQGSFWSGLSSSFPSDPYILYFPFFYQNYILKIDKIFTDQYKADPRNDQRLISAFKNRGLLHSGLSAEISDIVKDGSQVKFSFIITNRDKSDLLILDPEKTGPNLFHYFTNAPIFYNKSLVKVYNVYIEHQTPSPYNSWKIEWLSLLKSGDSRKLTFSYAIVTPFNKGEYRVSFEFPGLSYQITIDQLYQGNKRIWLGSIPMTKELTVD